MVSFALLVVLVVFIDDGLNGIGYFCIFVPIVYEHLCYPVQFLVGAVPGGTVGQCSLDVSADGST